MSFWGIVGAIIGAALILMVLYRTALLGEKSGSAFQVLWRDERWGNLGRASRNAR